MFFISSCLICFENFIPVNKLNLAFSGLEKEFLDLVFTAGTAAQHPWLRAIFGLGVDFFIGNFWDRIFYRE